MSAVSPRLLAVVAYGVSTIALTIAIAARPPAIATYHATRDLVANHRIVVGDVAADPAARFGPDVDTGAFTATHATHAVASGGAIAAADVANAPNFARRHASPESVVWIPLGASGGADDRTTVDPGTRVDVCPAAGPERACLANLEIAAVVCSAAPPTPVCAAGVWSPVATRTRVAAMPTPTLFVRYGR